MPVLISLLRGINLGGHHKIKMDELRALCESLKLRESRTHIQSGNLLFRTDEKDLPGLAKRIEDAIERKFGFHADVVLRAASDLRSVIAKNPFAKRPGIEPGKLIVTFLARDLDKQTRAALLAIQANPEEIQLGRAEVYVYFPDGMGRSKLPPALDRVLKKAGTARNWNTVTKLLEMAEEMESSR